MNRQLGDPAELETLVRATAFRLLLDRREPIRADVLARASGIRPETLAGMLDQLSLAGRIRRDDRGSVAGSAGLSVVPDRHMIEIKGGRFWTWCAYDIFGIFGALAASGRASSPSPADWKPIEVCFSRGRPAQIEAVLFRPDTALMECCDNVYEQWCPNSNLFATRELAEAWATVHSLKGRVLGLDEAADLATAEWKQMKGDKGKFPTLQPQRQVEKLRN